MPITFYSNTPDDTHCFQAAFRSVLDVLVPDGDFSHDELDEITHKLPGMWTWPTASLLWMKSRGFKAKIIETFDSNRFAEIGEKYLAEEHGKEIAKEQVKFSDIDSEQSLMKKLVESDLQDVRVPSIYDIDTLIQHGYFVVCTVNSRVFDDTEGYTGHAVLIKEVDIENNSIKFNDPGLPPIENRETTIKLFEKAWGYGGDKMKSLIAFKK